MTTELKPSLRSSASTSAVIVTIAPCGGSQSEARIGLRLKGTRTQYICVVSDLYRTLSDWHGQKEAAAKRAAKKSGIPWKTARKQFLAANSI